MDDGGTSRGQREARAAPDDVAASVDREGRESTGAILGVPPAIVGYWDANLENRMANPTYISWFGYSPEKMYGLHMREVIGSHLFDLNRPYIEGALAGDPQTFERSIVMADGTSRHTVVSYMPDVAEDAVVGFFVLELDITARKVAEEQLAGEKERIATILDSVSEGVVSLDPALRVTHLNAAATALTGYTADQARLLPLATVLPVASEGSHPPLVALCHEVAITGQPVTVAVTDVLRIEGRPDIPVDYRITPVCTAAGELSGIVVTLQDLTDSRALLVQIREHAQHDPLTGLWNRNYLRERAWGAAVEGPTSVLFVDLDNFKAINDTCGHLAGDSALVEVSAVLASNVRPADEVIRLGGDEFVVVLRRCGLAHAGAIAESLGAALAARRFTWGGHSFRLGASIGAACDATGLVTVEALIREADHACYVAKRGGGGTFSLADSGELSS